jgi:Skp family chaperone for outer membrane proteins
MSMIRLALFASLSLFAAGGPLAAAETIEVEKVPKAQLQAALKAAADDALIERNGVTKTKAQWRGDWQAAEKPLDPAHAKQHADAIKAKYDADAKKLGDDQDRAIAAENAAAEAEFEKLRAR